LNVAAESIMIAPMIEVSRRGRIAVLTLSRPPVNAIDDEMIAAFHRVLDELAGRSDWQVLHIRSAQKVFAAGADLDLIRSWKDAASPSAALAAYVDRLQGLYHRIEQLPQVTLAEIGGKIGLPEVGIGLIPGAGGTQRLTRLCGRGVASRIILGCEPVDGRIAATLGMVQWSVPRAEIEQKARAIGDRIAELPAHALRVAKQCIGAFGGTELHGYQLERQLGGALLDSRQTQDLIGAFLDKNSKRP
jgi:enoyl-CoA hydratase